MTGVTIKAPIKGVYIHRPLALLLFNGDNQASPFEGLGIFLNVVPDEYGDFSAFDKGDALKELLAHGVSS
jgi:hypothetical protein